MDDRPYYYKTCPDLLGPEDECDRTETGGL